MARSAAVLCALRRAAADRHALRAVLFLGGLLAFGFLFGGQAQAAESPAPTTVEAELGATAAPREQVRRVAADSVEAARSLVPVDAVDVDAVDAEAVGHAGVLDVADTVDVAGAVDVDVAGAIDTAGTVDAALESVESLQPRHAVDAVRKAAKPVAGVVQGVAEPLRSAAASMPYANAVPSLPGPPSFPFEPSAPSVVTPPGVDAGLGRTAERPVDQTADQTANQSADSSAAERAARAGVPQGIVVGVWPVAAERGDASLFGRLAVRAPVPAPAPAPTRPCDFAHGAMQQSGETHTPRKGDQPAAALADGAALVLIPGAGGAATEPPTRERPREILEFPG
ncbi:hypothetical protein AB0M39_04885 [Streptomyces sp. NPDC051907]|uniref:hypothetical protein n=1 Tax=Streptomyces sp. NPDC051907 TaxID=3155284 RepID=UPI00343F2820